jgi:hypothetical protein
MNPLLRLSHSLKTYPYRERLPIAAMLLCLLAWNVHTSKSVTDSELLIVAPLAIASFLDWKNRPFWFLWGIVVGICLVSELPRLHSILGH